MQAYFSDEDYWPAVVQGLDNGAVVYFDTSGGWHALHDDGWASAVNRMQVQFPQENDQDYVKVVVGLENSSLLYYDGTGVSIGSDSIGWYELHDGQWDSSTEGLCAYFPTDNNDEDNIKVVTGLGDGAVLYWNSGGFSELAASGVEGTNVGVADLHCSWEHGVVEVVATYANSPVVYYSEDDAYTCFGGTHDGAACTVATENVDCPQGSCTRWKSLAPYDVGDNNQLLAFSADFAGTPTTGVPRVAGGYQRPGTSIVKWLECKVCNKVVNKLINDAVSELDCDENCIEFAQEFGGGPEDPVADFVSAACIYICPKFVDRVSGEGAQEVCTEANLCN